MKKIIFRVVLAAIVLGAAYGGYYFFSSKYHNAARQVATTKVRRGDVVIRSFTRGELRAVRSISLTAPNLAGTVQITRLAPLGGLAKEKDLIVEFDDSEVQSRLEEKELELEQTDESIKKAQADLAITQNQDQVDLLRARYAVRRAELNVKLNEVVSAIDAKKNLLALDESKRRLTQLESDVKSRFEQAESQLAVLREQRNRSVLELQRERQRLTQTKLLTPMTGLVAIRQNRSSSFYFSGMQLPDFREGDQVYPGNLVADVLDLSEVEVVAKVGELDRANLREGQEVMMGLDAIANKRFKGQIKSMSGTASANVYSGDPSKKFDVVFSIDMSELMAALGAKQEQIRRVMDTAARNRNKPVAAGPPTLMSDLFKPGGPGPGSRAEKAPEKGGKAPAKGIGKIPTPTGPDAQKQFQDAMKKALGGKNVQDLTPEERQKMTAKMKEILGSQSGGESSGRRRKSESKSASPGGPAAPPGAPQPPDETDLVQMSTIAVQQFSEQDLANAKLPPPPEENSQLDVLLRPGLLADVEIIEEKMPDAIHVPNQAIFEKDGKPLVYVKIGDRFEERFVKPLKRSESFMVIASGLSGGEVVALADPYETKKEKQKKGGGAMGGMS